MIIQIIIIIYHENDEKNFININKQSIKIEEKYINCKKENFQNIEINNIETKKIKHDKIIFNMIILHTGNIAISSIGTVSIYNSNNLLSPNEKDYLLQKINIARNKMVSYIFEYPDNPPGLYIFGAALVMFFITFILINRLSITCLINKFLMLLNFG